jgi:hypothetical protein
MDELMKAAIIVIGVQVTLTIFRELKDLFLPLIKKNGGKNGSSCCFPADVDMRKMSHQVDDLHEWLGLRDESGAFPWAVGPVLNRLADILDRMDRRQERMENTVIEIRRYQTKE